MAYIVSFSLCCRLSYKYRWQSPCAKSDFSLATMHNNIVAGNIPGMSRSLRITTNIFHRVSSRYVPSWLFIALCRAVDVVAPERRRLRTSDDFCELQSIPSPASTINPAKYHFIVMISYCICRFHNLNSGWVSCTECNGCVCVWWGTAFNWSIREHAIECRIYGVYWYSQIAASTTYKHMAHGEISSLQCLEKWHDRFTDAIDGRYDEKSMWRSRVFSSDDNFFAVFARPLSSFVQCTQFPITNANDKCTGSSGNVILYPITGGRKANSLPPALQSTCHSLESDRRRKEWFQ